MAEKYIFLSGCTKLVEDCIWVSLTEFNGLVKIDINTGEIFFVGEFPFEDRGYQLHNKICEYDNKLFFSPWNTNNITVYDLENKEFRKIPMEDCGYLSAGRVVTTVQKDENLFFILENAREIIEFDMQREKIRKKYVLLEKDADMASFEYMKPIRTQDDIWGISEKSDMSWKFNLVSRKCKNIKLFHENMSIYAGCASSDYMWLLTENSVLYQITSTGEIDKEYDLSEIMKCKLDKLKSDMEDDERNHFNSIFLKKWIFIIWYEKKEIIQIPFKKNIVDLSEYKVISYDRAEFSLSDQLIVSVNNKLIVFDGDAIKEIEVKKTPDFIEEILKIPNKRLIESGCIQLDDFLTYLELREEQLKIPKNGVTVTAGNGIYRAIE